MPTPSRAHDCLVNVHFGEVEQPDWMFRVKNEYFKRDDSIFGHWEMSKVLEEMDENGVEKAVLTASVDGPNTSALAFVEARPDRFVLTAGGLDLLRPMPSLRKLEAFVADHPVAFASVGPAFWGDGRYPPDDAVYFPLYTKCCELDLPLCMNAGLPGPPIPGEAQNPIYYDRVCVRFPELKLCMIHGADPWWEVAIRLMIKYPNLHLMTSAWAPKYLPESSSTTCGRGARRRSSSPRTHRCCRSPARSPRPASSTCRRRCSTTTSTATPSACSSTGSTHRHRHERAHPRHRRHRAERLPRGPAPRRTVQHHVLAMQRALADSGVAKADIDGYMCARRRAHGRRRPPSTWPSTSASTTAGSTAR